MQLCSECPSPWQLGDSWADISGEGSSAAAPPRGRVWRHVASHPQQLDRLDNQSSLFQRFFFFHFVHFWFGSCVTRVDGSQLLAIKFARSIFFYPQICVQYLAPAHTSPRPPHTHFFFFATIMLKRLSENHCFSNSTQQRLTPLRSCAVSGKHIQNAKIVFLQQIWTIKSSRETSRRQHPAAEALLIAAISGSLGNSSFTLSEDHSG